MSVELKSAIEQIGQNFDTFASNFDDRLAAMEMQLDRPKGVVRRPDVKAFSDYLRSGKAETKEMSIDGGAADGQAAVPEFIANEILDQALSQSQIARHVRRTQVDTSDYARLVNLRGQAAAWSSEVGTRSNTATLQFREVRPTHGELYSVVPVSNWLLNDSKFNLPAMISANASDQFAKALDAALYDGDGTDKPTGIFNTPPVTTADFASPLRNAAALQYIDTTGDAANDIVDLYFTLAPEYRRNARFAMSSGVLADIRKLRDSNGSGFLWQQNLAQGIDAQDGLLVGRPVNTWEDLPATYATSPQGFKVLCGDFAAGYELIEIGPMTIIRDPYTVKGKTLFYLYQRFGGKIVDNNAIKVLSA